MLVLRESQVIALYTFLLSTLAGALFTLALHWPFLPTYLVTLLTAGPALAILRGRDRTRDQLNVAERAVAEMMALVELIIVGTLLQRWVP